MIGSKITFPTSLLPSSFVPVTLLPHRSCLGVLVVLMKGFAFESIPVPAANNRSNQSVSQSTDQLNGPVLHEELQEVLPIQFNLATNSTQPGRKLLSVICTTNPLPHYATVATIVVILETSIQKVKRGVPRAFAPGVLIYYTAVCTLRSISAVDR